MRGKGHEKELRLVQQRDRTQVEESTADVDYGLLLARELARLFCK